MKSIFDLLVVLPLALVSPLANAQNGDHSQHALTPPCRWLEPPVPSPVDTLILGTSSGNGNPKVRVYMPSLCYPCKYSLDDHSSHDDLWKEKIDELPNSVYETTDMGATWKRVGRGEYYSEVFPARTGELRAPSDSKVLYQDNFEASRRTFNRSDDGGTSWIRPKFLLADQASAGAASLSFDLQAISFSEPLTLYATVVDWSPGAGKVMGKPLGLYISTDGGDSWRQFARDITGMTFEGGLPFPSAAVAIAPSNASVMYGFAGGDLVKTADAGHTWVHLGMADLLGAKQKPADAGAPALADAHENKFYVSFSDVPRYSLQQVVVDPSDENIVFVVEEAGGVLRSTDGGMKWMELRGVEFNNLDANNVVMDKSNPTRVLAGGRSGLYISDDLGDHFRRVAVPQSCPAAQ